MPFLSRRALLRATGILLVGYGVGLPATGAAAADLSARGRDVGALDTWLAVARDGTVTAYTGRVELGTGIQTALAQIVAEELAVPFAAVRVVQGDTKQTPDQGRSTASQGVVAGSQPLQVAAARARLALIDLAARAWNVSPATLAAIDGEVVAISGPPRRAGYRDLIGDRRFAIDLTVVDRKQWGPVLASPAPLRDPSSYRIVGTSVPRVDVPDKVFGRFTYAHNVRLPNMLHARVIRPQSIGATLLSFDDATLPAGTGVRVVRERNFVAVVGSRESDVVAAARALDVRWSAEAKLPEQSALFADLRSARTIGDAVATNRGDVVRGLAAAAKRFDADYAMPYQLHGMLGPSAAVADVRADGATIWSGTQSPYSDRDDIADMLGLPHESVSLIYREASGAYGRLATDDAAADAALLSKLTGAPVRVQWMRHDEHGWEPPCPAMSIRVRGALDDAGRVTAVEYTQWSPSHATGEKGNQLAWRALGTAPGTGRLSGWASDIPYYDIPSVRIRNVYVEPFLRNVYMRAPGAIQSIFALESFLDEAAHATGSDPVEFRLRHLTDARDRAALLRVAELASWETSPAFAGGRDGTVVRGRGVAFARAGARDTRVAMALDVTVDRASGLVRLQHLFIAVDCGLVVNPDGARNQIEGGALQGLSRALKEEVRFDRSAVTSTDWKSYPILRFSEVPAVTVALIDHPELPPSAIGESAVVPTAAVLANAIFDATGRRLRRTPFTPERVLAG
jgi:CO/xanthine dehydrogenase Mo-binding subunit